MTGKRYRTGFSKPAVLLIILAVILSAGFLGYRYRGAIRLKMLDILHSFDDEPETPDSMAWMDDMPPGLWWPARDIGQERELTPEQQEALNNIKTLEGLIPICSICKKIRDDTGYWNQIEAYIQAHTEANFSHGICPGCAKKHYPDFDLYPDKNDADG